MLCYVTIMSIAARELTEIWNVNGTEKFGTHYTATQSIGFNRECEKY